MKRLLALTLLAALLLLPGCGDEASPPEPIFALKFWEMDEAALAEALLAEGWEQWDYLGTGIDCYIGTALGRTAYLLAEYSAKTGLVTAIHVKTDQYPAAMADDWETALARTKANNPHIPSLDLPWSYYEGDGAPAMAQWLSEAKAAVLAAGGTIAEEGTYRLTGATPEELCATIEGPMKLQLPMLEYGEQFYRLPNGLFCSYHAAAWRGWLYLHGIEPHPKIAARIFLCTEDYVADDYRWKSGIAPQHETYETTVDRPTDLSEFIS